MSAAVALAWAACAATVMAQDHAPPNFPGEYAQAYSDPLAPFNERMFWFNLKLDHYVLHPVAQGYAKIAPTPVREGGG